MVTTRLVMPYLVSSLMPDTAMEANIITAAPPRTLWGISVISSLFSSLPTTSFSQNVGLVTMTKVVNRMALTCGAVFLVLAGLSPKLAAVRRSRRR